MNRMQLIRIHMILAAFLLPVALLYFVSGLLYSLDVKGSVDKKEVTIHLPQPFVADLDETTKLVEQTLMQNQLPALSISEPSLKKKKGVYTWYWSELKYAVHLEAKAGASKAKLTFRERSMLAQVMRIHRAEAGTLFMWVSILLVVGLVMIFATGMLMAHGVAKFWHDAWRASTLGLVMVVVLILSQ